MVERSLSYIDPLDFQRSVVSGVKNPIDGDRRENDSRLEFALLENMIVSLRADEKGVI